LQLLPRPPPDSGAQRAHARETTLNNDDLDADIGITGRHGFLRSQASPGLEAPFCCSGARSEAPPVGKSVPRQSSRRKASAMQKAAPQRERERGRAALVLLPSTLENVSDRGINLCEWLSEFVQRWRQTVIVV
jgi:hypothetical protein